MLYVEEDEDGCFAEEEPFAWDELCRARDGYGAVAGVP